MTAGLTFAAAFLGVLARISLPYLRKKRKQDKLEFRYVYFLRMVGDKIIAEEIRRVLLKEEEIYK